MSKGKIFGYTLLGIVLLVGLTFGLRFLGIIQFQIFAPMEEDIKRKVFENTQSYVEGKRQDLTRYRLEYMRTSDPVEKAAIKAMIVQSFANFTEIEKLEDQVLIEFLQEMKYGAYVPIQSSDSINY